MNDRELLELAAKAAGYVITEGSQRYRAFLCKGGIEWNPLEDDGDALRLAVKLRLKIQITDHGASARLGFTNLSLVALDETPDVEAATRAAIVRAAAEIGRAMP